MAGLFSKPKSQDIPNIEAPPPMPVVDSEEMRKAKRKSVAAQRARKGRLSTIFTDPNETLGGG